MCTENKLVERNSMLVDYVFGAVPEELSRVLAVESVRQHHFHFGVICRLPVRGDAECMAGGALRLSAPKPEAAVRREAYLTTLSVVQGAYCQGLCAPRTLLREHHVPTPRTCRSSGSMCPRHTNFSTPSSRTRYPYSPSCASAVGAKRVIVQSLPRSESIKRCAVAESVFAACGVRPSSVVRRSFAMSMESLVSHTATKGVVVKPCDHEGRR